ncbi:MAG: ATP synthase subunit I [Burkholderiaceae bacterium]|jgi:ATP synthase protein I|nr:ATP synthase subunit I [Burkholderiaceae bacterium]
MRWGRIISLQVLVAGLTVSVAFWLGGALAGVASALACASAIVPNALMGAGFYVNDRVFKRSAGAVLFTLELVKIALTVVLLVVVFWLYKGVHWFAFLVSFVVTLKSYIVIVILFRWKN